MAKDETKLTTAHLRAVLMQQIELLREDRISPLRAIAVASTARQVLASLHIDAMYDAHRERVGRLPPPVVISEGSGDGD